MRALLTLARTKDEYSLIVSLLACSAATGVDMNIEVHKSEMAEMVREHLAGYRALPRSVDSYD